MIPLRHIAATMQMHAPRGFSGDHPAIEVAFINGSFVSRWEPTPAELMTLTEGGSVEVWSFGSMAPLMLQAVPHVEKV